MTTIEHPLFQVRQVEHCWITLRDGVRLSARLWLPQHRSSGTSPAILEYIPYRKRDMSRIRDERNHKYFAQHGYASVRVDMRGSGDSEGLMTDMYQPAELDDAIDVIEWIATQPWCDGSVGMMGTSWGGTSSLQAAARRPQALKAVIAVCATANRFDDDIHHMGGCLLTDTIEWGATLPTILASPPDPATVGTAWRDMWMARLDGLSFPLEHWVRHETRDDYWRWGSVIEEPDAIDCPVLMVGGWVDRYSNSVMSLLAQVHDRCWGIVGPWGHHYPDQGEPGPGIGFQQEAVRWWDHWLKGADTGVAREPRLRVWMQGYDPPRDSIRTRAGGWIGEPDWPSLNVEPRHYWLGSGRLQPNRTEITEEIRVPSNLQAGAAAGDTGYFGRSGGLPLDQQADDEHSLFFETEPLQEPLEVLGSADLTLQLRTDQPVASLIARLNDVPPAGAIGRVSYAVRNLALDENGVEIEYAAPDKPLMLRVDFPNTAYRFERGHRIRLAFSTSYWPVIWPSPKQANVVLHLAGARLTLPVRSKPDDDLTVSFAAPLRSEPPAAKMISSPPLKRWAQPDPGSGGRSSGWYQPCKQVAFTDIDLEFGFETRATHTLEDNRPTAASSRFEHRLQFHRDDCMIEITGMAELTATDKTYNLVGAVEATENGELVFERHWTPVIPRLFS